MPPTSTPENNHGKAPFRVWDFHPRIEHYRMALWDQLHILGEGIYEHTACGPMTDGGAFGGGERPYFRDFPTDFKNHFGLNLLEWRDAEKIVAAEKPEVVILTADPHNKTNWRMPKVVHEYGGSVVCWTKLHSHSRVPDFISHAIKMRLFRKFDRAICYGQQTLHQLTAMGFPAERARVAQNTIDTRRIFDDGDTIRARGQELKTDAGLGDAKIISCIGRMDPDKRQQDLLDIWPRLRALDDKLALVLISGGPMLEEIRANAAKVDAERILVTGRVPEGDDYCWIAASDVSVYPGAVGLAMNQSLALGCPTIIADESGSDSEILVHDKTGWRFPRGDHDALVHTIGEVLNDEATRKRITDAAVVMMRDEVTVENQARSIDQTIRDAYLGSRVYQQRENRT